MPVLDRSELKESSLADLHAIADQLGLEGFRRMRKADLIDAILGSSPGGDGGSTGDDGEGDEAKASDRSASKTASAEREPSASASAESEAGSTRSRRSRFRTRRSRRAETETETESRNEREDAVSEGEDEESTGGSTAKELRSRKDAPAEGVVELLGNGSAFLRVNPPETSSEDVYISAAQVRRCELVSGDRVSGPVRAPRRSERYPSLVRIETINGAPAGEVSDGARYEDRPVAYPSERIALESEDPVLHAIEWLTPFGRGSRVLISGPARTGKTEILRRLAGVLAGREGLEVALVLAGVRPEEIAQWSADPLTPASALDFAASADSQDQAVTRAIETAKRTAARGGDALVLIDSLDGLHPHAARRTMAAARNLSDENGGSLTIVATATRPLGGETTVIALDPMLAAAGEGVPLNLLASGTVRAELLVGEEGASAIASARATAVEAAH
jgi:transcription termination factor Rho